MQRHITRGREKPPTCRRRESTQNLQTCWTRQYNACPEAPSLSCSTNPPSPRMALASAPLVPHTPTRTHRTLHTPHMPHTPHPYRASSLLPPPSFPPHTHLKPHPHPHVQQSCARVCTCYDVLHRSPWQHGWISSNYASCADNMLKRSRRSEK